MKDYFEGLGRPIVVDVGSGNHPFPLANVLVDLYENDNLHRERGESLVRDERRFVCADVQDLPFPDKSIDFLYCAGVVEHVADPAKALEEIKRVSKSSIILVPTYSREYTASQKDPEGWETHLWLFWEQSDGVHICKKPGFFDGLFVGTSEYLVMRIDD